jgi:hypothetical protein
MHKVNFVFAEFLVKERLLNLEDNLGGVEYLGYVFNEFCARLSVKFVGVERAESRALFKKYGMTVFTMLATVSGMAATRLSSCIISLGIPIIINAS